MCIYIYVYIHIYVYICIHMCIYQLLVSSESPWRSPRKASRPEPSACHVPSTPNPPTKSFPTKSP